MAAGQHQQARGGTESLPTTTIKQAAEAVLADTTEAVEQVALQNHGLMTDLGLLVEQPALLARLARMTVRQVDEAKVATLALPAQLPMAQARAFLVAVAAAQSTALEVLAYPVEPA